ncbi:hypothetical protein BGX27_009130 [Mortierella sp. AM989]|nr:hypothetical protein BGX27_009130 [Mortierella sp. AM989]
MHLDEEESDEADIEDDDVPYSPHNRPYRQEEPGSQDDNNAIARRTAKDGTMYTQDMQQNDPPKEVVGGFCKVQELPYVQSLRHPSMLNGDVAENYGSPVDRSLQQRQGSLEERNMSQAAIGGVCRYVDEVKDVLFKYDDLYKSRPHDFWKKYKVSHSSLAEVARRFLCVQSASYESERVFSRAGYLTSDRRAHLGTNHLHDLLFSRSIASALAALQEERKKTDEIAAQRP